MPIPMPTTTIPTTIMITTTIMTTVMIIIITTMSMATATAKAGKSPARRRAEVGLMEAAACLFRSSARPHM
jgi:hypothetical protein